MTEYKTTTTELQWVPITKVLPNPLNPRKDHTVKTENLQHIIRTKGWEEGITVYKQNAFFVILSGHRRWNAARELGVKEVPIYIVDKPKTKQEEVERIASLQSAHEEWTKYEWAKFAYEAWVNHGKPPYAKFCNVINFKQKTLQNYVRIIQFFPREEIEQGLEDRMLSVDTLAEIITWMRKFRENHNELYTSLGEDFIRTVLIDKAKKKKISKSSLTGDHFIMNATQDQLLDFIRTEAKTLTQAQAEVSEESKEKAINFKTVTRRMKYMSNDINNVKPRNPQEWDHYKKNVENLEMTIRKIEKKLK